MSDAEPAYRSRKLCLHNLTVCVQFQRKTKTKCIFFSWNKCNGKGGSYEIGSCTLVVQDHIRFCMEVSLFMDACGSHELYNYMKLLYKII